MGIFGSVTLVYVLTSCGIFVLDFLNPVGLLVTRNEWYNMVWYYSVLWFVTGPGGELFVAKWTTQKRYVDLRERNSPP